MLRNTKKLSVIISTMNSLLTTQFCISCLRENIDSSITEIIVIDNASEDGTAAWLEGEKDIHLIKNAEPHSLAASFNQGLTVATGEEILFMHNDAFLPPNTIKRLEEVLFCRESIGAVSPVSNSNHLVMNCLTKYKKTYKDYNAAKEFAEKIYSESGADICGRLILEDVCLLVKKNAVTTTGFFDERFAVRFGEDFDYSLRLLKAGWELVLAQGIYIHHQRGATFTANHLDEEKAFFMFMKILEEKWGMDFLYSSNVRFELLEEIDYSLPDLAVLDIGCAMGGNFAHIKCERPDARLCGIELNPNTASIASSFGDVKQADVEELDIPEWEGAFDYIIMGDILEHLREPQNVLLNVKKLLKKNGMLIVSLPNVMNVEVVLQLLNGNWKYERAGILDRTHLRFFTKREALTMFEEAGYKAECFDGSKTVMNDVLSCFLGELRDLKTLKIDTEQMQYIQFFFKASPLRE